MLSSGSPLYDILPQLLLVVLIIPSIVLHEMAHGFAAYKLGDPTAKSQGRLSPNPLKHLDLVGSIILPLILALGGGPVIGFAKPVPYNPRYFKNIRVGELVVGLAGPFANLLLALVGALEHLAHVAEERAVGREVVFERLVVPDGDADALKHR